jgi:hypothetical protein
MLSLSMLCASLVAFLVLIARRGEVHVHQAEHLADRHLTPPDLSALNASAAPNIDLAAVRDNAVFYTHRAFFQAPPPAQSVPLPEYDFAGSIGLPQGKRIAFVKKKSDKSNRTVHVGDDLDGWRVQSIEAQEVIIVRDSQKIELKSGSAAPGSGLVHGTVTPYVVQSGMRTIGGGTATIQPPQPVKREPRTYPPPPSRN